MILRGLYDSPISKRLPGKPYILTLFSHHNTSEEIQESGQNEDQKLGAA